MKLTKSAKCKMQSVKFRIAKFSLVLMMIFSTISVPVTIVRAQADIPKVNINDSSFKLLICDGPEQINHIFTDPVTKKTTVDTTRKVNEDFIPCDFRGAMMQVQYLINVALVFGVLVAILGFTKAGILYISGDPKKISEAHGVFSSVVWGFVIMLSAWFIVYQILIWLIGSNTAGVLLGNP